MFVTLLISPPRGAISATLHLFTCPGSFGVESVRFWGVVQTLKLAIRGRASHPTLGQFRRCLVRVSSILPKRKCMSNWRVEEGSANEKPTFDCSSKTDHIAEEGKHSVRVMLNEFLFPLQPSCARKPVILVCVRERVSLCFRFTGNELLIG